MKKILLYLLGAVILFGIGFYVGRLQSRETVKIEYVKGETITESIRVPYPIFVDIPAKPLLPIKSDTIYIDDIQYITQEVDTAAIISDYILTRTYGFNVFDNKEYGKFDVLQKIGYNKLLSFDYTYIPIQKVTTITQRPIWEPFITGGYNTNKSFLMGAGLYYRHLGVEYNYNVNLKSISDEIPYLLNQNNNYHTFKLNYKF